MEAVVEEAEILTVAEEAEVAVAVQGEEDEVDQITTTTEAVARITINLSSKRQLRNSKEVSQAIIRRASRIEA